MKRTNTLRNTLIMGAFLVALSGCDMNQGPAEEAGEKIDEATEKAGEKIEDAGEKLQEKAE